MVPGSNKRKRRKITSGDKLVDWIFSRVIRGLNCRVKDIHVRHILRERYRGCQMDFYGINDDGIIYLSGAKSKHPDRRAMAKTLLHEVFHVVFESLRERDILRLEDLVWERLSKEQITILKFYIPRHTVKNL